METIINNILGFFIPVLVIGLLIAAAVRYLIKSLTPKMSEPATVDRLFTVTTQKAGIRAQRDIPVYLADFKTETELRTVDVPQHVFGALKEGDSAVLTTRGGRFISFE